MRHWQAKNSKLAIGWLTIGLTKFVAPCHGRSQVATRILRAVADNILPAYIRLQGWPQPDNNPTLGVMMIMMMMMMMMV
eukprot:2036652-Karenia_brevis.AAC.1